MSDVVRLDRESIEALAAATAAAMAAEVARLVLEGHAGEAARALPCSLPRRWRSGSACRAGGCMTTATSSGQCGSGRGRRAGCASTRTRSPRRCTPAVPAGSQTRPDLARGRGFGSSCRSRLSTISCSLCRKSGATRWPRALAHVRTAIRGHGATWAPGVALGPLGPRPRPPAMGPAPARGELPLA
jgi:hypothetical protein